MRKLSKRILQSPEDFLREVYCDLTYQSLQPHLIAQILRVEQNHQQNPRVRFFMDKIRQHPKSQNESF